jgi:hypothetical protein
MQFEAALLLIGVLLVLAIGFWKAAERSTRPPGEAVSSRAPELQKSV